MSPYLNDDEVLIFGKKSEPPTWADALFEEHFEAFRWSSPVLGPILRETEDAHRRAFELLTMQVPQRLKAVRTLPYRDLQVAQFLIEEGAKVLSKFPEVAEERAALAEVIAAQSWPEARSKALEAIRRWLLQRKDLADVCFCSIDLAFAYAKQGKGQQRLPELLTDIAKLPGAPEQPWALGSLWTFREVLQQRGDPATAAHEGAEIVHRRTWSLRMRQASSIDAVQT